MAGIPMQEHEKEIQKNLEAWSRKPLLRKIYKDYHEAIARLVPKNSNGLIVELGSGIGNIKDTIPSCVRTDLFPNPWIDRVENAYELTFDDHSVSALILFDVFHHLRYPGTAFKEFMRVIAPKGRVIIFDPCMSLAGYLIYGLFHHEPVGAGKPIEWLSPEGWKPRTDTYYAAQGNASRVFFGGAYAALLRDWIVVFRRRFSAFSYVLSGGYSKPQMYPDSWYSLMKAADTVLNAMPVFFATRLLVALERRDI
jgi:SAM-dependent methyltransferase